MTATALPPGDVPSRLSTRWDWVAGYALIGVAGVVLLYTWVAVSDSRSISGQLSYIVSGGFGGLVLLGLGAVLVVTAGLADEWRKLNRLEDALPLPSAGPRIPGFALVRRARFVAGVGALVAAAFVVPAWYEISGDPDPKPAFEAVPWAVGGIVVGGLISALATMRVQQQIQTRKRRLFGPWAAAVTTPEDPLPRATDEEPSSQVLVAPELTRFHRPGCRAVEGVATHGVELRNVPPDLEPCELCEADTMAREERRWTSVAG